MIGKTAIIIGHETNGVTEVHGFEMGTKVKIQEILEDEKSVVATGPIDGMEDVPQWVPIEHLKICGED